MAKKFKKVICIGQGKECSKNGSRDIYKSFKKKLKDQKFESESLPIKTKCLDYCKDSPIVINNDVLITEFK